MSLLYGIKNTFEFLYCQEMLSILLFCHSSYSEKKPQRVALLFEDEDDDDDKGPLFGIKAAVNKNAPAAKVSAPS